MTFAINYYRPKNLQTFLKMVTKILTKTHVFLDKKFRRGLKKSAHPNTLLSDLGCIFSATFFLSRNGCFSFRNISEKRITQKK